MNVLPSPRIIRSQHVYDTDTDGPRMERTECAECGLDADVRVELGDHAAGTEDVPTLYICLPCLKRAVVEAEAAVARDKA